MPSQWQYIANGNTERVYERVWQSIKLQESPTRLSSLDDVCYSFGVLHLELESTDVLTKEEMIWQKQLGKKKKSTCSEVVICWKSHRFQFTISNKFYPQISTATPDIRWAVLTTVSSKHWGKAEWSIPNLNVVKFTFPRGLNWIIIFKV